MTAADKKIILEHGSDYVLRLKIKADDGINNRDMSNWTWKFDIYNSAGVKLISADHVSPRDTSAIVLANELVLDQLTNNTYKAISEESLGVDGIPTHPFIDTVYWALISTPTMAIDAISGTFSDDEDTVNGDVIVLIDSAVIDSIPTLVTGDDAFATQYNYYHTLTVTEPGAGTVGVRAMRLLRGKLAVRL